VIAERREFSRAEREDIYYHLLAGASGCRILESVIELKLPDLLAKKGPLTADELIAALALHHQRGRKWLLMLCHLGLIEEAPDPGMLPAKYQAGPLMRAFWHKDGSMGFFYRDFLRFWRTSHAFDLVQVIRGQPVPQVPYPPASLEEAQKLEAWMRETARETVATIERALSFEGVERLLDVGGGDGTVAVHYARRYPQLHTTVFNLPNSAYLARQNIAREGLADRVSVVEGDFRRDPLPQGYQLVQFSRVLADWPDDVCQMLLAKAWQSLLPGGRVLICDPLADDNPDLTLAWESTYIAYDDFGVGVYKPLASYERLLTQVGFKILQVTRKHQDSTHAVIVAQRL